MFLTVNCSIEKEFKLKRISQVARLILDEKSIKKPRKSIRGFLYSKYLF